MVKFYIQDDAQANAIIEAYNKCVGCNECYLNTAEGWRCSYLYKQAIKHFEKRNNQIMGAMS